MDYKEATDWLYMQLPMFSRVGAAAYKPGLETSVRLDNYLGNPHKKFKSIHVGGTNGKGSTSHMLASILQEQGYKTGLYTSPHLVDFRERMRIDGQMIPREKVVEFVERWKNSGYEGSPSFFELTMVMAFDWFANEGVDYAVIEVGMGGRLDSTNIITPELSIITNISKDHTQFLGDTLPKIAAEKAGIIKKGIPVVIGERGASDIEEVFLKKANEESSPIYFAQDKETDVDFKENEESGLDFTVKDNDKGVTTSQKLTEKNLLTFHVPLGGDYQKKNVLTVLKAVEILRQRGVEISEKSLRDGLYGVCKNTGLMGRWSIIKNAPVVICDTGHNIGGLEYNFRQLKNLLEKKKDGKLRMVIGFVADKAIDDIINILPRNAEYYLTNAKIPRALPVEVLKKKFDEAGIEGKSYPDSTKAYQAALADSTLNDIIYVGGSTFIVADLLSGLQGEHSNGITVNKNTSAKVLNT